MTFEDLPELQLSLAQTIAWCSAQQLEANPIEPLSIQRRRAMIDEGTRLMHLAFARAQRRWFSNKDPWERREYKTGQQLIRKAEPTSIVPLRNQLRSDVLNPMLPPHRTLTNLEWDETVRCVISRRAGLTGGKKNDTTAISGKLLIYVPEENLCDGAAIYPSKGFFDVNNAPPWDLWVHFSEKTLISWVPMILVPLVQAGINANPEECIRWLQQGQKNSRPAGTPDNSPALQRWGKI